MSEALGLLVAFAREVIPRIPGVAPLLIDFWGRHQLGPMPPDLAAWDSIDARIDRERVALHDTDPPPEP
jgi:hypothetical protein